MCFGGGSKTRSHSNDFISKSKYVFIICLIYFVPYTSIRAGKQNRIVEERVEDNRDVDVGICICSSIRELVTTK